MDNCFCLGDVRRNFVGYFVIVSLSLLVGQQIYAYIVGSTDSFEGTLSDVKYMVMQLTRGLSEINRKHERLQAEMKHIETALPTVTAGANRAKEALDTSFGKKKRNILDLRDYDRQMADFALETAGAKIVDTGDTIEHMEFESPVGWALHTLTTWLCRGCFGARAILRPGSMPGECWAFKGSRGEVTIRLPGAVRVNSISVEHIPFHISPTREISSAPRLIQVEGLEFRSDLYPHDFGSFEYDKDRKPIQYFEVIHPSPKPYNYVKLRVLSNWGNPIYTCVYRIRIHGELESGPILKKIDDELQIENEDK